MISMYKELKIFFAISILSATLLGASGSYAQKYPGDFTPVDTAQPSTPDYSAPIPRIFSSKVSNASLVEKLDVTYDNLLMSLWNYGSVGFIHQETLSNLMKPQKFRTTRYAKEFTPAMQSALQDLNDNYKSMMQEIESANAEYKNILRGLKMADKAELEPLWEDKISSFKKDAETFFKMQHSYLNTYRNLVAFVLEQGGSYYYKQDTQGVYFYKFGSYKFFGKSIDKMRMITYKQKQFLKARAPANADALVLQ